MGLYIAGKKIDPVKTEFTVMVKAVYHDFQTKRALYAGNQAPPDKQYLFVLLENNRADIVRMIEKMAVTSDIEANVTVKNEIDWRYTSWEQAVLNCNHALSTELGRKTHPLLGGKPVTKPKIATTPLLLSSNASSQNMNPRLPVSLYPSKPVSLYPSKPTAYSQKSVSADTEEMEIKKLSLELHYSEDFENALGGFVDFLFNVVLRAPELNSGVNGTELKEGLQKILTMGKETILAVQSIEKSSESKSAQKQPRSAPKFGLVADVYRFLQKFIESKVSFLPTPKLWVGQSQNFKKQCELTIGELFNQAKANYARLEKSEEHHAS